MCNGTMMRSPLTVVEWMVHNVSDSVILALLIMEADRGHTEGPIVNRFVYITGLALHALLKPDSRK